MAKYFAIVANENGEAVRTPLFPWFRQNQQLFPEGFLKQGDNTQALRRKLVASGWKESIGTETAFIIKPNANGSIDYAQNYVEDLNIEVEEHEDTYEEAQEITFGLEKDLQQALRRNIQSIELGLEITDGGKERHTEAGFIDITAKDAQGRKVVIELKAPVAKPEVIAQTLAYMQALQSEDNVEVRGIIIASDFVDRVKLAARQIPNLKLVKYAFQFSFNEVE